MLLSCSPLPRSEKHALGCARLVPKCGDTLELKVELFVQVVVDAFPKRLHPCGILCRT